MRKYLILIFFIITLSAHAQEKVSFQANDGLRITADLYLSDFKKPFILLFHQAESSRGEFRDIAPKLQKLGYNCLAVDLRSGGKSNYIPNETVRRAIKDKYIIRFIEAKKDIEAAIDFTRRYNQKPVILFGSSYSASLALIIASNNPRINSVIAFSPGEYFMPELSVRDSIKGVDQPVFIASTQIEYPYAKELYDSISSSYKIVFKPSNSRGIHGAKALWPQYEESNEYWLSLSQFFRNL